MATESFSSLSPRPGKKLPSIFMINRGGENGEDSGGARGERLNTLVDQDFTHVELGPHINSTPAGKECIAQSLDLKLIFDFLIF